MTPETYELQFNAFCKNQDSRFPRIERLRCLQDDTEGQSDYCPIYAHHCGWQSRILMRSKPAHHTDFGGLVYFATIASAIVPFTYYDLRPIHCCLPNLTTKTADLTNLSIDTNSLPSVGCCHVLEHVGMGRYGDKLDVCGDLKAANELKRIVAPKGQLLIVLPVGQPRAVFNAHRIYSYEQVLDMFSGLALKEFTLFDPPHYIENANPKRVIGLTEGAGCFWFVKE